MVAAIIVYLGRVLPIATGLEGSREFSEVLCYAVGGGYHPVNTNIEIHQVVTCHWCSLLCAAWTDFQLIRQLGLNL